MARQPKKIRGVKPEPSGKHVGRRITREERIKLARMRTERTDRRLEKRIDSAIKDLESTELNIRVKAVNLLGRLPSRAKRALPALEKALEKEPEAVLKRLIKQKIAKITEAEL